MSNTKENRVKKDHARQMYMEMEKSIEEIAVLLSVTPKTIENWRRKENWDDQKNEIVQIEKRIEINAKKALNEGLKAYANSPANCDLQSLVSLLKSYNDKNKPSQAYKENIIKFLDRTVDYFMEKDMKETAQIFKESLTPLAEYLLKRG